MASFPYLRMRRGRSSAWMRAMLAENRLHPSDFIWPLFICEGRDCAEPIGSLPGVSRWSVDRIAAQAKEAAALGIPTFAWFGPTHPDTWQPPGERHGHWRTSLPCRGCDRTRCPHWNCLPGLAGADAAARVLAHLARHVRDGQTAPGA